MLRGRSADFQAGLAVTIQRNHRWTQMNTDKDCSKRHFPRAGIRSPESDPKQGATKPESSPRNLCSSVSICGFPLHGNGLGHPHSSIVRVPGASPGLIEAGVADKGKSGPGIGIGRLRPAGVKRPQFRAQRLHQASWGPKGNPGWPPGVFHVTNGPEGKGQEAARQMAPG